MKKKVAEIKLQIAAGKANPSPPIGPALGQKGLNIVEFCKQFNDRTKDMEVGMPVPVIITAYADRSFTFIIKTPPTSFLLKKAANVANGSKIAGREVIAKVPVSEVKRIAIMKMEDMGIDSLESAINNVIGTARSMGIEVIDS